MANASLADHKFYVYVHTRLATGEPFYIGKGSGGRCISEHNRNAHWKNIVTKDKGFVTSFIASGINEELALLVEIESISIYRLRGSPLVNATLGGDGISGHRHSIESRQRMSSSHAGVKLSETHRINAASALIGRIVPQHTRDKISASNKGIKPSALAIARSIAARTGKKHTEEHKAKISLALKGRPCNNRTNQSHRRGKTHSEESRKKMSDSRKGQVNSESTRELLRIRTLAHWAKIKQSGRRTLKNV